jgi:hypothetical protein
MIGVVMQSLLRNGFSKRIVILLAVFKSLLDLTTLAFSAISYIAPRETGLALFQLP